MARVTCPFVAVTLALRVVFIFIFFFAMIVLYQLSYLSDFSTHMMITTVCTAREYEGGRYSFDTTALNGRAPKIMLRISCLFQTLLKFLFFATRYPFESYWADSESNIKNIVFRFKESYDHFAIQFFFLW